MAWTTPIALRRGDTIAIVPTARAISAEELRDGIALAERWGLKVKLGAGIGRKHFQQASIHIEEHCHCTDMALTLNHGELHRAAEADHR